MLSFTRGHVDCEEIKATAQKEIYDIVDFERQFDTAVVFRVFSSVKRLTDSLRVLKNWQEFENSETSQLRMSVPESPKTVPAFQENYHHPVSAPRQVNQNQGYQDTETEFRRLRSDRIQSRSVSKQNQYQQNSTSCPKHPHGKPPNSQKFREILEESKSSNRYLGFDQPDARNLQNEQRGRYVSQLASPKYNSTVIQQYNEQEQKYQSSPQQIVQNSTIGLSSLNSPHLSRYSSNNIQNGETNHYQTSTIERNFRHQQQSPTQSGFQHVNVTVPRGQESLVRHEIQENPRVHHIHINTTHSNSPVQKHSLQNSVIEEVSSYPATTKVFKSSNQHQSHCLQHPNLDRTATTTTSHTVNSPYPNRIDHITHGRFSQTQRLHQCNEDKKRPANAMEMEELRRYNQRLEIDNDLLKEELQTNIEIIAEKKKGEIDLQDRNSFLETKLQQIQIDFQTLKREHVIIQQKTVTVPQAPIHITTEPQQIHTTYVKTPTSDKASYLEKKVDELLDVNEKLRNEIDDIRDHTRDVMASSEARERLVKALKREIRDLNEKVDFFKENFDSSQKELSKLKEARDELVKSKDGIILQKKAYETKISDLEKEIVEFDNEVKTNYEFLENSEQVKKKLEEDNNNLKKHIEELEGYIEEEKDQHSVELEQQEAKINSLMGKATALEDEREKMVQIIEEIGQVSYLYFIKRNNRAILDYFYF